MTLACVVTSIQPPTPAMRAMAARLPADAMFLVAGDRKGPSRWDLPRAELLTLQRQLALPHSLGKLLPVGHYCRKNLAYLEAIARGATKIFETDDDNEPLPSWSVRERRCDATASEPRDWINAYGFFTRDLAWPRGLPLNRIRDAAPTIAGAPELRDAPIQQALADGSPDVDAAWRLILDKPLTFDRNPSIWLPPGSACPFNSQATWWWREAFPLLYLPSTPSFRMTDIWRGFVAQRCLWEMGKGLVFHAAEMLQERNEHDLMRDFEDEIPGYRLNDRILATLKATKLTGDAGSDIVLCWQALADAGLSDPAEVPLAQAWVRDLERVAR